MSNQTHIPGCTNSSMEPTNCPCGCHRGIINAAHEVKRRKVPRLPLDPHFIPECVKCGPLDRPLDLEDAQRISRRHESTHAAESVAGAVASE